MLSALVFPGNPRSSGHDEWKSKPNPRPAHPTAGHRVLHTGGPILVPPAVTVTFPPRASPACSVRLWLAPTPHSAVGPGDLPVPGAVVVTPGRAEGLAVLASLRVAVSETASHLPASQLFCQQIEGCRLRLSVALAALPLWIPPCPAHPRL